MDFLRLKLVAGQSVTEPVDPSEAAEWVGDGTSESMTALFGLLVAAREWIEERTERQIATAKWDLFLDGFPSVCDDGGVIELRRCPVQSPLLSLKYYDADGVLVTMDAADYQLDHISEPGLLYAAPGLSWPATQAGRRNAVQVQFNAGYGTAVPERVKLIMKLLVGYWFDAPEKVGSLEDAAMERTVESLIMSLGWSGHA